MPLGSDDLGFVARMGGGRYPDAPSSQQNLKTP
jgi:hypothetical protein